MKIGLGILDKELRDKIKAILQDEVHTVFRAEGGAAFRQALRDWPPLDLAIVDVRMPDITTFEVIRLIRCDKKLEKLPVVVVGSADQEDLRMIEHFSGVYLKVPFERRTLLAAVRKAVEVVAAT